MVLAVSVILSGSLSSCGPGDPETYGECLVDLGRTRTAEDAVTLCRQAFPEPFYSGDFFYGPRRGGQCATIGFDETGRVKALDSGFCGGESRIECDAGGCRFTCRSYDGSDSSIVRIAREIESGIELLVTDTSTSGRLLWRQRADCEVAMDEIEVTVDSILRAYFDSVR